MTMAAIIGGDVQFTDPLAFLKEVQPLCAARTKEYLGIPPIPG